MISKRRRPCPAPQAREPSFTARVGGTIQRKRHWQSPGFIVPPDSLQGHDPTPKHSPSAPPPLIQRAPPLAGPHTHTHTHPRVEAQAPPTAQRVRHSHCPPCPAFLNAPEIRRPLSLRGGHRANHTGAALPSSLARATAPNYPRSLPGRRPLLPTRFEATHFKC